MVVGSGGFYCYCQFASWEITLLIYRIFFVATVADLIDGTSEPTIEELRLRFFLDDSMLFSGLPEGTRLFAFDWNGEQFVVCSNDENVGRAWYRELSKAAEHPLLGAADWYKRLGKNHLVIKEFLERKHNEGDTLETTVE